MTNIFCSPEYDLCFEQVVVNKILMLHHILACKNVNMNMKKTIITDIWINLEKSREYIHKSLINLNGTPLCQVSSGPNLCRQVPEKQV